MADSIDNRSSQCNFIKEVLGVKTDRFKIYEKDFCDHSENIAEVTPSSVISVIHSSRQFPNCTKIGDFSKSPALQVYGSYGLDEIEEEIFDTPNTCELYSQFDNHLTPHFLNKAKFQQLVNVMNNDPVFSSENTSEVSNVSISQNTDESESTENRYAIPQNSKKESAFREGRRTPTWTTSMKIHYLVL